MTRQYVLCSLCSSATFVSPLPTLPHTHTHTYTLLKHSLHIQTYSYFGLSEHITSPYIQECSQPISFRSHYQRYSGGKWWILPFITLLFWCLYTVWTTVYICANSRWWWYVGRGVTKGSSAKFLAYTHFFIIMFASRTYEASRIKIIVSSCLNGNWVQ